MPIRTMNQDDMISVTSLFNEVCHLQKLPYQPLNDQSCYSYFLGYDKANLSFVLYEDHDVIGFISGFVGEDKAYISMIMVHPNHQRKSYGTSLLQTFENHVKSLSYAINSIDLVFFNPVHLSWFISNTPQHTHPNAPGVLLDSNAYYFFIKHNYQTYAIQNSYYKPLIQDNYDFNMNNRLFELNQQGISITCYNPKIHSSFEALFDDLNNDSWKKAIEDTLFKRKDILVVTDHNHVIGFAGPLDVEPSQRGYFAGIGIHSKYRSQKIGKVLFHILTVELKKRGATFMSLFTGDQNPARYVYEHEGFKIVATWANMRKHISSY
jgi:ribosomal protein S18 acetylase RimI-like enzyme